MIHIIMRGQRKAKDRILSSIHDKYTGPPIQMIIQRLTKTKESEVVLWMQLRQVTVNAIALVAGMWFPAFRPVSVPVRV